MTTTTFENSIKIKSMQLVSEHDPILTNPTEPVDLARLPDLYSTIDEMFMIMHASNGIGLAAPQVGLNLRMFIMQINTERYVVINPIIVSASDATVLGKEGCLTYPKLELNVKRPEWITAIWYDQTGQVHQQQLVGLAARCFAHEYDHLMGVCFVDRVSKLAMTMAKVKMKKKQRTAK
jgi:peptide deformylase